MKENKAGTSVVSRYDYTVNAIGQRTNVAQTGTAFGSVRDIAWGYNAKGEVTKADSTIPGLDRAYAFDMIGNRLKSADSLTLPAANNYTPNALNQYSSITNPQSAILNPIHDADGNMTSGPLPANVNANSALVWDGENRLIQAQVNGGATVNFTYDAQSRRIAETIGTTTKITIYDGWNPIAEYSTTYALTKTYIWGVDLSGSMQGAGGVGGLLAVTDSTGTYFPTFDGNGNVSEYLDSTGAIAAHYEYDPFGKTTVATGPKANDFAHRFSTKPLDATTGLYYYGYRYYDPVTGRWPSRDPIGERGGVNLYGFVYNSPSDWLDLLGREPFKKIHWEEYWKQYQEKYPDMTDQQKRWAEQMLALGCKGVTCLNIGDRPSYNNCFKTKEAAIEKQAQLNENRDCCAKVFSVHFWNDGKDGDNPEVTFSRKGKANMRKWDESGRPGKNKNGDDWISFDFGFLNPDGTLTHADQYYNPDRDGDNDGDYFPKRKYPNTPIRKEAWIYISTEEEWRKSYEDFNDEVWCTQCISNKSGVTE